ncbi:LysR family transcriptional regulator [Thermomonospora umbrina]|nr:LysR family transcriptional regulator [Thermomonospora umbrina]
MERQTPPTVNQLRIFLALTEELHFGRTAARLFISQPALSKQILALERTLGVKLLERGGRAVRITEAGEAVRHEARAVIEAVHRLQRVADEHARTPKAHVVVGTVGAEAAMPHFQAVMAELRRLSPGVSVESRLLDLVDQFRALERGAVDVVFCRPPVPNGISVLHLTTEPRVVCLPAADPLAADPAVSLSQLGRFDVVSFPPECSQEWRDFWSVVPRPDGTTVRYGPIVRDVETMLAVIGRGESIAFLPAAARTLFPRPGVAYRDVTDLPPCTSGLAWLAERNDPGVTAVHRAARSAFPHARRSASPHRDGSA